MSRINTRTTLLVAALTVFMVLFAAGTAGPAMAAPLKPACQIDENGKCLPPPCMQTPNSRDCDGTDPIGSGCKAGAYVAASTPLYYYDPDNGRRTGPTIGRLSNWYSPNCGTNWAEFNTGGAVLDLSLSICINNGATCERYSTVGFDSWTDQVYAPATVATAWAECTGPASGSVSS